MIYLLAHVKIADYSRFLATFTTETRELRERYGCKGATVYQTDGLKSLTILFTWTSSAAFERFRNDPEVKRRLDSGSVTEPPTFVELHKLGEFPA